MQRAYWRKWNNSHEVWNSANSIFIWRYLCRRRPGCVRFLMASNGRHLIYNFKHFTNLNGSLTLYNIQHTLYNIECNLIGCWNRRLIHSCGTHVPLLSNEVVNLRNRTGKERRRQSLCDKRDNSFVWNNFSPNLTFLYTDLFVKGQKTLVLILFEKTFHQTSHTF